MTSLELGNILKKMYETKGVNKTTMIHLFGVIYADEIRDAGIKPIEIVKAAQMPGVGDIISDSLIRYG